MNDQKIVDPKLYDSEYYLTDCDGYKEYVYGIEQGGHPRYHDALDLAAPRSGENVLDIGCGRGEIAYHCALAGCCVTALDYSEAAIALTRETVMHLPPEVQRNVRVQQADFVQFETNERFDIIFMLDIIEHLYDWQIEATLAKIHGLMSPKSRLLIKTPNDAYERYFYPFKRIVSLPFTVLKQISRLIRGKKRPASVGEWFRQTFKFSMHRNDLIDEMHVNVKTPGQLRCMLKAFDADVRCVDHSKNILSLLFARWWGREIVVIARLK